MKPAVVVLGAGGRLGPVIASRLRQAGWDVLACSRRSGDIPGFDVLDRSWQQPSRWRSALAAHGVREQDLAGAVNLVAGRRERPDQAEVTGIAAVRCTAAAVALNPGAVSLHVASVSERRAGRASAYARGKAAARAEACALRLSAVLTVGVVPRPTGDPSDAYLRRVAEFLPKIAALPIDVSTPGQVAGAIETLLRSDWQAVTAKRPAEITLTGTRRTLGAVLGCSATRRLHPCAERALLLCLAGLPLTTHTRAGRVLALARQATGRMPSHYLTRAPEGGAAITVLPGGWRLTGVAGSPEIWLAPDTPKEQE